MTNLEHQRYEEGLVVENATLRAVLQRARETLSALGLPHCSQCGQPFEASACWPTHAMVAAERAQACPSLGDLQRVQIQLAETSASLSECGNGRAREWGRAERERERADRLAKVLAFVEWGPLNGDERCPCCGRPKRLDHREHCMLKAVLRGDDERGEGKK